MIIEKKQPEQKQDLPVLFGYSESVDPVKIVLPSQLVGLTQIARAIKAISVIGPDIPLDIEHHAALVLVKTEISIGEKVIKAEANDWLVFSARGDVYVIENKLFTERFPDVVKAYMANYVNVLPKHAL